MVALMLRPRETDCILVWCSLVEVNNQQLKRLFSGAETLPAFSDWSPKWIPFLDLGNQRF